MNYKQLSGEIPAIMPNGFTGVISKHSNLVLNKSFIEKGTTLINAFDNSNVILKDCGVPEVGTSISNEQYNQSKLKLSLENDIFDLPPWIHYKIKKDVYSNQDYWYSPNAKFVFRLGSVGNLNADIDKFRQKIEESGSNNNYVINPILTLESQIELNNLQTANVETTNTGEYMLSDVESSIRAVWPLNNQYKDALESPKLNLHFVKRLIYPFIDKNNKNYYIEGVKRTDSLGNLLIDPTGTIDIKTPGSHKYLVKVLNNEIQFENQTYKINKDDNGRPYINYEVHNDKKYIMNPYLDSLNSLSYKIQLYTANGIIQNIVNDEPGKEATLYFKRNYDLADGSTNLGNYNTSASSLFDIINNEALLNEYKENYDFDVSSGKIYLSAISVNTSKYKAEADDNKPEQVNILGLKFLESGSLNQSFYRLYNNDIDVTDNIVGGKPSVNLPDFFETCSKSIDGSKYESNNIISTSISSGTFISGFGDDFTDFKTSSEITNYDITLSADVSATIDRNDIGVNGNISSSIELFGRNFKKDYKGTLDFSNCRVNFDIDIYGYNNSFVPVYLKIGTIDRWGNI